MKRAISQLCVVILAGLSSSCIEFEEQTMSYCYDQASDQLRIYQDYRGIFGADAEGKAGVPLSSSEQGQLQSVLDGQHTFFFANWIFEYDREAMQQALADLNNPAKSEVAAADKPRAENLYKLAIDQIRVTNGTFYLGAGGKLCGVQSVTIDKFSEIVAAINQCKPIFLKDMGKNEDTTPADLEAIAKFEKDPHATLVQVDGNALTLRMPMARGSYDTELGPKAKDPDKLKEMRAAGIAITWEDAVASFSIGKKDDPITRLTLSSSEAKYTPNAIPLARAKHTIKEKFDAPAAAKTFLLSKGTAK